MNRPRVLLADDHAIVAEGLRRILSSDFEIAGVVKDGQTLVAAARALEPDVIVADITMPVMNGIDAARQIKAADPKVKIIFLTMHLDVTYATEALQAGGSGYVVKTSAGDELVTAIREALEGRIYLAPEIAGAVKKALADAAGG